MKFTSGQMVHLAYGVDFCVCSGVHDDIGSEVR